ncbi:hypothetical protein niasHT_035695 [Heterodera trifolii]|uniref:Uncharacterized protein n=1 Tax=Heterodera trifolii TaxID=157864 RepID=A0ABD2HZI7_9BILA
MELLPFFLFCASFFCVPLSQVKAAPKKGPLFDVSPPRDRPSDQPSLTDLLQEGPPSMYQTQHRRGSSALPHFGAMANLTESLEVLNWEMPPDNVPSLMDDKDSFGTNGQPSSEATNPFASHPNGKQSPIGRNEKGAANASWHVPERAAETASANPANVTSSSSTQEDSSHSRRNTVDITKSRRTRRPSIAENEPITKQLNDLAIKEQSLNADFASAAADMSSESVHIKPQASDQTNKQKPINPQASGQTNKPINPQASGQTNKQKTIMAQPVGHTNYQNPINPQLIGQSNYQNPINSQRIGQTNFTPNEWYYQNQAQIPTYNFPTEIYGLQQNQAPQMANAPANLANSTETAVRPNEKKTTSKPRKKNDSQNVFADNHMPTQYPNVPISKWTSHKLPVHPEELRAEGQFDVKKKFPKETNEFDKIAEFMDDTGEWIKIEVKQGKAVAIYLRNLSGNLPQIEEPMDLTFGGKKRFLRTNGTEILYPAEIIYSWTKYQFPVHPEDLKAGGQFDVKEKYPTETNGLDKIAEFMDDTGEWIRIEAKQGNSGSKYVRDLFGNPPQIDGPIKLMFGEISQFVSIDGMLMTEENYEKVKKNNEKIEKNRKQAERYLNKLQKEEAKKERINRMFNLNWATNTFPNWNSQMPNANLFIPNNTFPAAGALQHNPPQRFGNYAMAPPIGALPLQGAAVFNAPQTINQTLTAGGLGTKQQFWQQQLPAGGFGNNQQFTQQQLPAGGFGNNQQFTQQQLPAGGFGNNQQFTQQQLPAGGFGNNQQFTQQPLPPGGIVTNPQFPNPTSQAGANYPFVPSASVPQTQSFPLSNALPFAMNSNGGSLTYPSQMNYAQMPAPAQNTHSEQVPKKKKNTSKKQMK